MNQEFGHMMNWEGYHMGWMGWIMMVGFWGFVIFGIVIFLRSLSVNKSDSENSDSAIDVLKKRYARGEIDEEEFEARKRVLTQSE